MLYVEESGAGEYWWKNSGDTFPPHGWIVFLTVVTLGEYFDTVVGIFQIAGLLASIVVLLVVVAIGFVFQPLPQVGGQHLSPTP